MCVCARAISHFVVTESGGSSESSAACTERQAGRQAGGGGGVLAAAQGAASLYAPVRAFPHESKDGPRRPKSEDGSGPVRAACVNRLSCGGSSSLDSGGHRELRRLDGPRHGWSSSVTISEIAATGLPHEERLSVRATILCPDAELLPPPVPCSPTDTHTLAHLVRA